MCKAVVERLILRDLLQVSFHFKVKDIQGILVVEMRKIESNLDCQQSHVHQLVWKIKLNLLHQAVAKKLDDCLVIDHLEEDIFVFALGYERGDDVHALNKQALEFLPRHLGGLRVYNVSPRAQTDLDYLAVKVFGDDHDLCVPIDLLVGHVIAQHPE